MTAPWPFFPLSLRLEGRRVLVVGGGEVAARKLRLLLKTGALVEVAARELNAEVSAWADLGRLAWLGSDFEPAMLAGCRLVIAATDDRALNRAVADAAERLGIPVNVVDDPGLSSAITPSIVDRAPLLVAISSAGSAPVLARRLRERIEALLPAGYGRLAQFMGAQRDAVQGRVAQAARREVWERFLDSPGAEAAVRGDDARAQAELERLMTGGEPLGEVYLVGAGPGDPDLLTLKALRLMQACDVVLFDALIPAAILDLVRRDAERIDVGKRRARHTLPQEQINAELVRLARAGKKVLRLKGGDPFVFGRGGEEIEELAAHGVPFQVVPGITAANGCAAYAGIPLTHRDYAQTCILVTGHARADGKLSLDWPQLARAGQTVVIYMGLNTLPGLCPELMAHGLPADWPAAVVESGTLAGQRVVCSDLGGLAQAVREAGLSGPSLVIVGEVVKLRDRLRWR